MQCPQLIHLLSFLLTAIMLGPLASTTVSHWIFISQSSFTSLFSTPPSGTRSFHFSFVPSWCNSHIYQCKILATLTRRLLYFFTGPTFCIYLLDDTNSLPFHRSFRLSGIVHALLYPSIFFNPSSVHLFLNSLLLTVSSVSLTPTVFAPLTTPLLHYLKYHPEPFPSLPIHLAHLINPRPPFTLGTFNIIIILYVLFLG